MNIYQALYDLVNQYVYGNSIVVGSHQDLVAVFIATCGCIFLVALPFLLVYKILKLL